MRCLRKFICICFIIFIFNCISLEVKAFDFPKDENGNIDEESQVYKDAKKIRDILITEGVTEECAYGILGNIMIETGYTLDPEINGGGHGLVQWQGTRWTNLIAWCGSNGYSYDSIEGQIHFLLHEISETPASGWKVNVIPTIDFFVLKDSISACEYFMVCCERCVHTSSHSNPCSICTPIISECVISDLGDPSPTGTWYQGASLRRDATVLCYEAFTGKEADYYDTQGSIGAVDSAKSSSLKGGALASELELGVTVTDWYDVAIDLPSSNDLELADRLKIANWKQDVEGSTGSSAITWIRSVVAFVGILIVIYSAFIYIAYWFDRINNFVEISMLNVITFGRLEISPDDKISTFSPKTQGKKLIVHRDAIFISLLGICFGVVLLSGLIYDIIYAILNLIRRFIK